MAAVLSAWGASAAIPSDALLAKLAPRGSVNDFAGILSPSERTTLESRVAQLRRANGAQFAVVILPSLEGGQVDDFTNKLFAKWGVGEQGKNNGIMLLVAIQDRKARVEVGYGLEPILPDALAGRVLDEQLFPAFKQQRYAQGLSQAVHRIADIVERGEPASPAPKAAGAPRAHPVPLAAQIFVLVFFGIWTTVAASMLGIAIGLRKPGQIVGAALVAAFMTGFCWIGRWSEQAPLLPYLLPPYGLAVGIFSGIMAWLNPERFRESSGRGGRWGSGGSSWSGGGFSSDSGGFSGGSDSSSFGGGSSGGGGASGSW